MKNKPVRIIQYIGSLNIGGSQSMIMELYRKINKEKVQFDFIVDRKNELFFAKEIESLGGKIYFLENYNGHNLKKYKRQWEEFFEKHPEYKIIHTHIRSTASIVLKIAKKYNLMTICHSHSTSNGNGIKSIVKKLLQRKIPQYSDYLFACSEKSAIWLYGNENSKKKNCIVINNAIDSTKYIFSEKKRENIRKKYNLKDRIVIGQIGRLTDVKNHLYSLEIMKKLYKINKKYTLIIIGDGENEEIIRKKINDYRLEKNVIMLGGRNDVNELMQAMDIFLMPSKYEGLPLALVEAQASSLPCIISNKITAGFLINELIHTLPIENIDVWVNEITSIVGSKRINRQQEIMDSGFDITKNVQWLEKFYLDKSQEVKV